MRKRFSVTIIKSLSESALIVFSVILAFYVENKRQDWAANKRLVSDLKELKGSIVDDTVVFRNLRSHYIPEKDTLDRETLDLIAKKERVSFILQGLWGNERLNYQNWTVSRMLQGDNLNSLGTEFRNTMWEYNRRMNDILNGNMNIIRQNDKKVLDIIFSELTYKDDFSKISGIGDDQPLIRYRSYKDSSVVYSDKIKGYFIYNLVALQSLSYELSHHRRDADEAISLIDKKIKELE